MPSRCVGAGPGSCSRRLLALAAAVSAAGPASAGPAPRARVDALTLPGGAKMPMVGLGLCCRDSAAGDAVRQGVYDFLMLGGRHLDDAELYSNHKEVGMGLRQALQAGVPREEVFVTTKISMEFFGFERAVKWVPQMLDELGLEYVDLVLLHWAGEENEICGSPRQCRLETWLALQRFWHGGQIKNLGVSNFGPRQIQDLMAMGGAPVAVNQLEYHPWSEVPHREAVEFCHRHGIALTAYGSMGSNRGAAQLTNEPTFTQIGQQHGKTGGQVLLRWAVQQNVSVIPGTGNPKHMQENLDIFDFELSDEAMGFLSSLSQGQSFNLFGHTPDLIA